MVQVVGPDEHLLRIGGDMRHQPLVLIVILNWNAAASTLAAVASLSPIDYGNWRALVIDNGSNDGSLDVLKSLANERIEVVGVETNTGYTGGCNLGLRHALEIGAKYTWLLNNDATTDAHTLSSLVALAESDDRIGLVSPLVATTGASGKVFFAGGRWNKQAAEYVDTHDVALARRWAKESPEALVVWGTAMLVPMKVVQAIGMLHEGFFAYYEDIDFSIRSLEAGFRNAMDFSSIVYHDNKNMNFPAEELKPHYCYYMARNERRFWRKHLGAFKSLRVSWWGTYHALQHRKRFAGFPNAREAILAGIWHGWIHKEGAYHSSFRAPRAISWLADLYEKRAFQRPT
jgi:GT2 family glycosyltransferase